MNKETIFTYPTIGFCFGFKDNISLSEILTIRNIKNWKQNQTLQSMNETFRRVTFDIKEVLINVSGGYDGDFEKVPFRYKVGQSRQDNVTNEVLEIYSEQGRCYSFFTRIVNTTDAVVKIVMNVTR